MQNKQKKMEEEEPSLRSSLDQSRCFVDKPVRNTVTKGESRY